jgi:hypothetical protein
MDHCARCGRQAETNARFCAGCGARLVPAGAGPPRHGAWFWSPPRWATAAGVFLIAAVCGGAVAAVMPGPFPADRVILSGNKIQTAPRSGTLRVGTLRVGAQPAATPRRASPHAWALAERAAARDLSRLLARSASDRSVIVDTVSEVNACGPDLTGDAQTFREAAGSRAQLLSELGALPDSSALPARMLQDLRGAWQSSSQADRDYASWADDESSAGCTPGDTSQASYEAATGPDNQATADKQAFVSLWDPIAARYGLPAYQWNGL